MIMEAIENFIALSVEEQIMFAKALLDKFNSEHIVSDKTILEFQDVEVDDIDGGLWITASPATPILVSREATWTAGDEEGASEDPGNEAEYMNLLRDDTKKTFKTLSAELDGYKVSLKIDDVDEDETIEAEVEVDKISHEDAGIGSYEFWGFNGYDSQPYVEVEGTITRAYDCTITIFVEPVAEI